MALGVAQSPDQNYVKSIEYIETVLVEDDFTSSFGGWLENGTVNYTLKNGKIRANVQTSYEGIKNPLKGFKTITGKTLKIKIDFSKGNTSSNIRLYLEERSPSGGLVSYNLKDGNLQTGTHEYTHVMNMSGNTMIFRIDKDNTNTSDKTFFDIDYVSLQIDTNLSIDKIESVTYFDGFGKAKQSVGIKQSPTKKDIVQHIQYDEFGRTTKQFLALPTTQDSGHYIPNAEAQITSYYQNAFADQHPFSEVRYDNSPLNRKIETAAPGNTWQLINNSGAGHTSKYDYDVNTLNEVFQIKINGNNTLNTFITSYYKAAELLKNSVKNENWTLSDGLLNTKEVFTDKNGKKIAEFSYESDAGSVKKLSTYYVYDDVGNLRYVLPPKMFPETSTAVNYENFSYEWEMGDFVSAGDNSGLIFLSIHNNVLRLSYLNSINDYQNTLNLQTTKALLPTEPTIPDMYIGQVMGKVAVSVDPYLLDPFNVGQASIKNGNLVINRTSTRLFSIFSEPISIQLDPIITILADLNDLAFQYKYDQFNRQIEQKVPGKDWEYMIYDQLDRPILTQDVNLRTQNKWLFNKYDVFGRVVYSGTYTNNISRPALQIQVDNFINASTNKANTVSRTTTASTIGGVSMNYTNTAFPNTNLETLTVSYFDDYNFTDSSLPTVPTSVLGQDVTDRTKGLLTANWTKTLGSTSWSKNYTFYDKKGRVIYAHDKNHLGGYTSNESQLDFRGKIQVSNTTHKRIATSDELIISDKFYYDHAERPLQHKQLINQIFPLVTSSDTDLVLYDPVTSSRIDVATNSITLRRGFRATGSTSLTYSAVIESQENPNAELIAANTYNELGQLKSKKVGGTADTGLQTINYTYNIRGWLTNINEVNNLGTDLFAYHLKYDTPTEGSAAVSNVYNGNIKQVIWKSAQNNLKKSYAFGYDKLNRFSKSIYRENNSLSGGIGKFETDQLGYDANGNIETLRRKNQAGSLMDQLVYHYDAGNKLKSIVDTSTSSGFNNGSTGTSLEDYTYDTNGNLTKDLNKGITIEYNHLDLVTHVAFSNGNKIEFDYDANGSKLRMRNIPVSGSTTTIDYLGGFQYTNTQLQFFPTPEGYVAKDGSTYKYVYLYKDHLGNNRVSFSDGDLDGSISPDNEILSNADYYVMGLTHAGETLSGIASNYNYKYQGKERLDFEGYNMYDFGSRMYDASVGRWFNADPQNQFASPYLAMGNNWVMSVDPDGESAFIIAGAFLGIIKGIHANQMNGDAPYSNFWKVAGSAGKGAATAIIFGPNAVIGDAIDFGTMGKASVEIPLGNHNTLTLSPSMLIGTGGSYNLGALASITHTNGDFSFTISGSWRKGQSTIGGGVSYYDRKNKQSFSFGITAYGGDERQNNWFTGFQKGDFSFRMTNDAFLGGDKGRTAAGEIGIGDYTFGTNIYTTAPPDSEYNSEDNQSVSTIDRTFKSKIWGANKNGTYSSGSRVYSGLYIGKRNGIFEQRWGIDGAFVQDFFQNGIHRHIVKGPYFNTNFGPPTRSFYQLRTNIPWSLY